jgi:hypothetical protein
VCQNGDHQWYRSQQICPSHTVNPMHCHPRYTPHSTQNQAPPSRLAYSSSMRSSYCLSGLVGSSIKIPSLINSSGFGRCEIFSFRLSARMCFSSSRCWPWIAGAAVESGRMLPVEGTLVSKHARNKPLF